MQVRHTTLIKSTRLLEAFEGHRALAGNFDGQVLSWGMLQWNVGQGTLRPLLLRILELDEPAMRAELGDDFITALTTSNAALAKFAHAHMLSRNSGALTAWQKKFARLNDLDAAAQAQAEAAEPYYRQALSIVRDVAFVSERGYALCLDVAVQNWSHKSRGRPELYRHHLDRLARGRPHADMAEWERMKAFAHAISEGADPQWRRDVLSRKLCIALGEGWVHGRYYHLESDFGIRYYTDESRTTLEPWADTN